MPRRPPVSPIVALAIVCLLSASARGSAQSSREALLLGSSSVGGAVGVTIADRLEARGVRLRRRARSSSGFARPDYFDWEAELPALGPFEPYRAVLVYAGGNDMQALRLMPAERAPGEEHRRWIRWREEERWTELYAQRVTRFIDELCVRGARRVIMVLPADGGRPRWTDRIDRVRRAQAAGARASRCGAAVDAGQRTFESVDGVHLSRRGARRFWEHIALELLALLDG